MNRRAASIVGVSFLLACGNSGSSGSSPAAGGATSVSSGGAASSGSGPGLGSSSGGGSGTRDGAADLTGATAVSAGLYSACALMLGGTVQCWGAGALGNGTMTSSSTPVAVSGLTGATAISVGGAFACALLSDGTVPCWGDNDYGQLGNGTTITSYLTTPVAVSGLAGATAVSAGQESACALLSGGAVRCWGDNSDGELGNGSTTGPDTCYHTSTTTLGSDSFDLPCSTSPVAVTGLAGATAISVGGNSACALLLDGAVQCWGQNRYGQLGNGTTITSTTPVAVSGLADATAVSTGGAYQGEGAACALLSGGTVQCWGDNYHGELGNGSTTGPDRCCGVGESDGGCAGTLPCSTTPVAVGGLMGATAISVGGVSTCALLSGGTVQCWGDNYYGELGIGTPSGPDTCAWGGPCSTTPVAVTRLTGAMAVSAGGAYAGGGVACALLSGGTVQCWGYNELGNGSTTGPDRCCQTGETASDEVCENGGACSPTPVTVQ